MSSLLIFVIILGVIIFVHELGHFVAAKSSGMRIDEFGFGFPPRLWGIKRGGTTYSLNWIPLGGFVKIKGENGEEAWESDSFASKSMPRRIMVILAGVSMNIILAFVLFTGGYLIGVPQAVDVPPAGAIVSDTSLQIGVVLHGSPAEKAGLQTGDIIGGIYSPSPYTSPITGKSIDESKVTSAVLKDFIINGPGYPFGLSYARGHVDPKCKMDCYPLTAEKIIAGPLAETGTRGIGVELIDVGTVRFPWYLAPVRGAQATAYMLWAIVVSFYGLLAGLFTGRGLSADVSGPIGIAVVTGQAVQFGFAYLVEFMALLSLNLAVVNAVPFPALDGGRFLFLVIEAVRRRPVSRRLEGIVHQIGFAVLMLLVVAVTYRDLVRYSGAIFGFFKGLI